MTESYINLSRKIIDAHPESVHQLLMSKGIDKPATPEVLLQAYILWGAPFLSELTDIVFSESKFSKFDGSAAESLTIATDPSVNPNTFKIDPSVQAKTFNEAVDTGTQKKTFWENLSTVFNSSANLANAGSNILNSLKSTSASIGSSLGLSGSNANMPKSGTGQGNTMLIVGIVVIVGLIIVVFLTRRK
ncbi:MAG: LPXTG cell wall anchor domain-containing protein [Candidatus Nanoarchaeia archaeon]|nr:LPXTG cell wall anchor domain-containing protein [Candidatus Nanoarchaeia archaeon]